MADEKADKLFKIMLTHVEWQDMGDSHGWCEEGQWLSWAKMEGLSESDAKAFYAAHAEKAALCDTVALQYKFCNQYVHYLEFAGKPQPITDEDRAAIKDIMAKAGI
mmetsp:Transcript_51575/g.116695  ORF Transcript_51575/g.116695 Transcript_51575/m.116695 type:complete len:106 (-) Transcript_51575:84-401(-)